MKRLILVVLILGAGAYFGAKFLMHYRVGEAVDDMLIMASPFVDIQYQGVSSSFDGRLSIDGVTIRMHEFREPVYIDRISVITPGFLFLISMGDTEKFVRDFEIPETFGFAFESLQVSTNADYFRELRERGKAEIEASDAQDVAAVCTGKYGFEPSTLEALGYTDLDISMSMAYRQTEQNLFLDITADIKDMYAFDITLTFADPLTPASLVGGNYRPRMAEGRLEYLDLSLKERTARLCAEQGLSDEEILTAQIDALQASGLENGLEFDEYVLDPYREFLEGKSTFILTAKPNEPISLTQIDLYKPEDVPALLNLTGEVY